MDPERLRLTGEGLLQGWSIFIEVYQKKKNREKSGKKATKKKIKLFQQVSYQTGKKKTEPRFDFLKTFSSMNPTRKRRKKENEA